MEKAKEKAKNQDVIGEDALMWAIGFTPADLAANQDGQLSPHQCDYFVQRKTFWMGLSILLILLFGYGIFNIVKLGLNTGLIVGSLVIIFLIRVSIIWSPFVRWKQLHEDVGAQEIGAIQGLVSLEIETSDSFRLKIGDERFSVKKDVFLAFKNGDPYAIYYAPHSKTILSAEWLRPE